MKLLRIQTRNFRNLLSLDLALNPSVNIIIGDNGAGKTNVLEAIEILVSGESFRSKDLAHFVNKASESKEFAIQGRVFDQGTSHDVVCKFANFRKSALIDNKRASVSNLRHRFGIVLFSPESLNVIKGGPSARRAIIDEVLVGATPSNAELLIEYNRCLRSRNTVLKNLQENARNTELRNVLNSLNPSFLYLATKLTYERIKVLKTLMETYPSRVREILKNQNLESGFDYRISDKSTIDWDANQVYDALNLRMQELATAEIASGQSLVGPHKHEVRFLFQGQDSRIFCSQGQQRSLILALKMAQVELQREAHGSYPILLLDDVFSELDSERQLSLLSCLRNLDAQIFLTNTAYDQRTSFEGKSESVFVIEKGRLKNEDGFSVGKPNASIW